VLQLNERNRNTFEEAYSIERKIIPVVTFSDALGQTKNMIRLVDLADERIEEEIKAERRAEESFAELINNKIYALEDEYRTIIETSSSLEQEIQRQKLEDLIEKRDRWKSVKTTRILQQKKQHWKQLDGTIANIVFVMSNETRMEWLTQKKLIDYGFVHISTPFAVLYKEAFPGEMDIDTRGISFRLAVPDTRENIFLKTNGQQPTKLCEWFEYIGIQLIRINPDNRVFFIQQEMPGKEDPRIGNVKNAGGFRFIRNQEEVHHLLKSILSEMKDLIENGKAVQPTYLLINGLNTSISPTDAEMMELIIRYGWKCGIFVIASFSDEIAIENCWQATWMEIHRRYVIHVNEGNQVYLRKGVLTLSPDMDKF